MKRKITSTEVGERLELEEDHILSLDVVIQFLSKAKDEGATHLSFYSYGYDGSVEEVELIPVKQEVESDEAYNIRLDRQRKNQEFKKMAEEAIEKREYERLKIKFEK